MQASIKVLSLSHEKAPVRIRERMHLDQPAAARLAEQLRLALGISEAMVLSTCNRTEVYYVAENDRADEILRLLAAEKGMPEAAPIASYFESVTENCSAILHLFEVSMGLRSQVVGDLQIANQVKQAYAQSVEMKLAGPLLHRLMHTVFHCNKRVQQETEYRDGAASVSYAAAGLARDLVAFHAAPSVLVLGLGEMGADVARHLKDSGFSRFALMNRTFSKAEALAAELGAEAIPAERLEEVLEDFMIVISAVGVEAPVIRPEMLRREQRLGQQYFVDLGVPRSIDPAVEQVPGAILYAIDEIRARTDETLQRRMQAVPRVRSIIHEEMSGFLSWSKELSISPVIQKLKDALDEIRKEEMARWLKNAEDENAELVEKITKSMMNKILKLPVLQLKAACKRGEQENLVEVLKDLFDLEKRPVRK